MLMRSGVDVDVDSVTKIKLRLNTFVSTEEFPATLLSLC